MLEDFENNMISIGPKYIDESIGFFKKNLPTREPIGQFKKWLTEVCKIPDIKYPAAMFLATVSLCGKVSNRIVLCRGYNKEGFIFYTDYLSPKASDLIKNPNAAATFHWGVAERSVRIEGVCSMFTDEEADEHFQKISPDERLAAKVGEQSAAYRDRYRIPAKYNDIRKQMIPGSYDKRPKFWGGFTLHPHRIEFWEGRSNGLNDRINFTRLKEECPTSTHSKFTVGVDDWTFKRLIP